MAGALSGCKPAQPSDSSWLTKAETSVGDVLSEVATAKLTLQNARKDRFVGRYPVVVLVYAEKAAGSATDKVTTMQPPRSERDRYRKLSTDLGDAVDLIAEARITLVDGDRSELPDLVKQLGSTADHLRTVDDQLTKAAGG